MSDVFISYAREDQPVVEVLVDRLQLQGLNVWWDRAGLKPGDDFARVIEGQIEQAKKVVVLWSSFHGTALS